MKLIAFYLPQFHPIPENDAWWGTGFTEWRNVAAARPRFVGHRQPRLPGELGFYDLRLPETRAAQAELARAHGISAFCYYHYWFNGRRLLERPFSEVLASGEPDFPFCLCWANEPWTRRWSDRDGEVLVAQEYSAADDLEHARYLAEVFADPRYLRIDGRPLLLVYRASTLPNAERTADLFRAEARRAGVGEPYLCRVESDPWRERRVALSELGFDSAVEFAPDWLGLGEPRHRSSSWSPPWNPLRRRQSADQIYDYAEVAQRALAQPEPPDGWLRCITPGWDNSPRRASGAVILDGSTPELYSAWLEELVRRAAHGPAERQLVFVNAWNEWAEGAVLEPDLEFGRAYLEATRRALAAGTGGRAELPEIRVAGRAPLPAVLLPAAGETPYRLHVPASLELAAEATSAIDAALGRRSFAPQVSTAAVNPAESAEPHPEKDAAAPASESQLPRLASRDGLLALAARARIAFDAWRYIARARWGARRPPLPAADSARLSTSPGRRVAAGPGRPSVLVVSPYPLYPTVSGGSVRIWNLLRGAADDFDLHVAVFSTTRDDADQRAALASFCRSVHFLRREDAPPPKPWSLLPRGAEYFAFDAARRRLRDLAESVDARIVQLEHTELGQFAGLFPGRKVTLTELDLSFVTAARRRALGFDRRFTVDRLLWFDTAGYRRLLRYEIRSAERCDQVHVMSATDGEILGRYLHDGERRLRVVDNGVDTARFRPRPASVPPAHDVLFLGSFGHSPNRDAIEWLLAEIWPRLRRLRPKVRLAIVGANPPAEISARHGRNGISVFGNVADTAEYYRGAQVLLAPIRAGSGTRLKLLEAFASGLPVVATRLAAEGLEVRDGEHLLTAESAEELARATARVLAEPELAARLGAAARRLAAERYDWQRCAGKLMSAWNELLVAPAGARSRRGREDAAVDAAEDAVADFAESAPRPARGAPPQFAGAAGRVTERREVEVSVVIPTRNGGERLVAALREIFRQQIDVAFEVVCVDSASSEADLARMRQFPVRIEPIPAASFNHGLTRDLGARLAQGRVLVFLNQDAVPVDRLWLHRITQPLLRPGLYAAVQGGIHELPQREEIFYWHSCGPRFYFTSESGDWIAAHGGIGFSTVNAAIRRSAWESLPFGWAPIMEDKKWQSAAAELGLRIVDLPEAAVLHSHTYDVRTLWRRAASEGFGWRLLGVRYSVSKMARDLFHRETFDLWLDGLRKGELRSLAERLFPWIRPLALYWGNRWARDVAL
ncbi:MAG: glycoside hydrolase family 99-like domain-containing protein [Thermoanaerobaculia bacterium]